MIVLREPTLGTNLLDMALVLSTVAAFKVVEFLSMLPVSSLPLQVVTATSSSWEIQFSTAVRLMYLASGPPTPLHDFPSPYNTPLLDPLRVLPPATVTLFGCGAKSARLVFDLVERLAMGLADTAIGVFSVLQVVVGEKVVLVREEPPTGRKQAVSERTCDW